MTPGWSIFFCTGLISLVFSIPSIVDKFIDKDQLSSFKEPKTSTHSNANHKPQSPTLKWDNHQLSNLGNNDIELNRKRAHCIINSSLKLGNSRNSSKGFCLRGVKRALYNAINSSNGEHINWQSMLVGPQIRKLRKRRRRRRVNPDSSAESFRIWASENPRDLCTKFGLVDIIHNTKVSSLAGAIYIYGAGKCGFHKRYGHAEIRTSNSMPYLGCSDHCRTIIKQCPPAMILAPATSCEHIILHQRELPLPWGYNKTPRL